MFNAVVASPKCVLDTLRRAAVSCNFELVVVCGGDDSLHFFQCHAKRVMVVDVRRSRIAGRIRLDPLDAVFDKGSYGFAGIILAVDDEDEPLHADSAELWILVH